MPLKKYNINFTINDVDFIFRLAESYHEDLLNYPELFYIRDKNFNRCIAHVFAINLVKLNQNNETYKKFVDFLINFKEVATQKDLRGYTPLHYMGMNACKEIMNVSEYNTVTNNYGDTPYCYLLLNTPTKFLKDCIVQEEVLKVVHSKGEYIKMPLDFLEKRTITPTINQLSDWGIFLGKYSRSEGRRKINGMDISNFKSNNSLRFILG